MKPLIFVVDDDMFFRNYITSILMMNNFDKVCSFSSGEMCIANLSMYPDIILLDHDMVGMSGTEVLRYLKENNLNIPVIMVSSRDDENLISEVVTLGVRKYIKKDDMLFKNIKEYFHKYYTNISKN